MGSVLKIAAGICLGLLAFVLIVGIFVSAAAREEERRQAEAVKASIDAMNSALSTLSQVQPARSVPPSMQLVDVGSLALDQTCVMGRVYVIDRSVPGSSTARPFLENGRPVMCHDRARQDYRPAAGSAAKPS